MTQTLSIKNLFDDLFLNEVVYLYPPKKNKIMTTICSWDVQLDVFNDQNLCLYLYDYDDYSRQRIIRKLELTNGNVSSFVFNEDGDCDLGKILFDLFIGKILENSRSDTPPDQKIIIDYFFLRGTNNQLILTLVTGSIFDVYYTTFLIDSPFTISDSPFNISDFI